MPRKEKPGVKISAVCEVCGKDFTFYKCWPKRYCSNACYLSSLPKKPETTCPTCGKVFSYHQSWPRVYCSHVCSGKANAKNFGEYFFPENLKKSACQQCGSDIVFNPKKTRGKFCNLKCFGAWKSANDIGENHPNFKGGYKEYYGPSWYKARRAARERDKVCQECGVSPEQLGKNLDVHHKRPFRLFGVERHLEANNLDNLMCLCPTCHTYVEWRDNRATLTAY